MHRINCGFLVRPMEPLYFGRPSSFSAGEARFGKSEFPPSPLAFQGLVRSHLLRCVENPALDLDDWSQCARKERETLVGRTESPSGGMAHHRPVPRVQRAGQGRFRTRHIPVVPLGADTPLPSETRTPPGPRPPGASRESGLERSFGPRRQRSPASFRTPGFGRGKAPGRMDRTGKPSFRAGGRRQWGVEKRPARKGVSAVRGGGGPAGSGHRPRDRIFHARACSTP